MDNRLTVAISITMCEFPISKSDIVHIQFEKFQHLFWLLTVFHLLWLTPIGTFICSIVIIRL